MSDSCHDCDFSHRLALERGLEISKLNQELTILRERVKELEESNASMDRLHAARMQECLEESKAKDARIRELEEAMPDAGNLRRIGYDAADKDLEAELDEIADEIEKVMTKQPGEKNE